MANSNLELLMAIAPIKHRHFIAENFHAVLHHPDFSNVLAGIVSEQRRTGLLPQRIAEIAEP